MAETLRELVVALSLDSSNFSRNMRTINQQIKEAESTFRLAGAGVENYEKTIAGTESKLSMLGQKLTQQQRAVEQYSRALVAANDKLKENYDRHQDYTQRLEQAKARQEDLRFEVKAAAYAYDNTRDSLGETDSPIEKTQPHIRTAGFCILYYMPLPHDTRHNHLAAEGVIRGSLPPDCNPQQRHARCEDEFLWSRNQPWVKKTTQLLRNKNSFLADLPPGSPFRDERQIRSGESVGRGQSPLPKSCSVADWTGSLSTFRPSQGWGRERGPGVPGCRSPGSRWSAPSRRRKRRFPARCGSPWSGR